MLISWLTSPLRRGARGEVRGTGVAVAERITRWVRILEETPPEGRGRAFSSTIQQAGVLGALTRRGGSLEDCLDEGLLLIASLASVAPDVALLAAGHVTALVTASLAEASALFGALAAGGIATSGAFDLSTPGSVLRGQRRGDRLILEGHRLLIPGLRSADRILVVVEVDGAAFLAVAPVTGDPLLEVRRSAFAVDGASTETAGVVWHGVTLPADAHLPIPGRDVAQLEGLARSVRDLCVLAVHRGIAARALSEAEAGRGAGSSDPLRGAAAGELLWILEHLEGLEFRTRRHLGGPSGEPLAGLALREAAQAARDVGDRVRRLLGPRGLAVGTVLSRLLREAEVLGIFERDRVALCAELGTRWEERRTAPSRGPDRPVTGSGAT